MSHQNANDAKKIELSEVELPKHLEDRMGQRGITREEVEYALNEGREATDAKAGTLGKVAVFSFQEEWQASIMTRKK